MVALISGAAGLGTSGAALAQQTASPAATADPTTLDAITVTGSRITIPGVTSNSPVTSIDRDDFLRTQPAAVEDFVKQIPSVTPSIGPGTNNGSTGAAELDLRGLGSNRTLVLVDGRRPVPYDLAGVVDTNTIPIALLQSVDLLTGGASVVYGADAISGVVNFMLRRDFEGAEFSTTYGQSKYGDGARQRSELTLGANTADGRGNAVLSFGYTKVDPVFQGSREYGEFALFSDDGTQGGSGTAIPGRFSVGSTVTGVPSLSGQQIDLATGALVPTYSFYNYAPLNYYQTGLDRYQATALGRFEINRHAEVYGQANYTRSRVASTLAPSGIFGESVNVPIGNPFIPEATRQQICAVRGIAAAGCVSGAAGTTVVPISISRRLVELGPRLNDFDTKTFQITAGLRGDISDNWSYDAFWSHGESEQLAVAGNWGSLSKVRQAMNAFSTTACVDPSNGCVPLNVWGDEGSITPEQLAFINLSSYSLQNVEQENAAFTVSGDLGGIKSPWSDYPIGIAAGVEYRKAEARTRADAASQIQGEVMGTGAPFPDRAGGFSLTEGFTEVIVPLVNGVPGAHTLSLELGYRRSDFSSDAGTGDDYGSWKYGLEWAPIESLRFRGMFQRATRAPNIGELFAPQVTGLDNLAVDPCAGAAISPADASTPGTLANLCRQTGVPTAFIGNLDQPSAGQVNVLVGGNPLLTPELADTQTLGFVWTPINDLAITFDYWKIELEEAVSEQSVADVVNGCYSTALNPGLTFNENCQLIGRSTANGTFNGSDSAGIGLLSSNLGRIKKDGFDLGVRYGQSLPESYGRLSLALDITKVRTDDFEATPTSGVRDCLGYYSTSCTPSHDLKSLFRTTWEVSDLSLSLAWRYYSSLEVEPGTGPWFEPFSTIPSTSYFDLGVGYSAPFNAEISLSVNNLTDKRPPIVGSDIGSTTENSGNTFPQWYDTVGRYYNLGVTFRF
ncbi:TonB-dependent receptor domain-containing protein [Luteimonas sp. WGS1318]|uniref:TonB-dependent receptor domain-containing protein n=1 Tax=Luteimonas sp. WGS1318 TaxID=3366815 RepID=UPI00372D4974